ncbi:MAG: SpoIID/LytB domain-containing protein [Deltaproteobacteria bacterium]|nr:SpoIID/LytB domain-containing protein [Deltaproteobacteria bacterium]
MRRLALLLVPLLLPWMAVAAEAAGTPPPSIDASTRRPSPPKLEGAPEDPLDRLNRPALDLAPGEEPRITVRLMRGQPRVRLRAVGGGLAASLRAGGVEGKSLHLPAEVWLTVGLEQHARGKRQQFPVVAELPPDEAAALEAVVREWKGRDEAVKIVEVGSVFGLAGRVIDTRQTLVLIDGPGSAQWASAASDRVAAVLGRPPDLYEKVLERASGELTLIREDGSPVATAESLASFRAEGEESYLEIDEVEYGRGYDWHGRERRSFFGTVHVAAGPEGLTVVNEVGLETLLRGVVPAETFASAHAEALAAQAVTARGEILAKVGTRHLGEPTLLCAEQHCQVYKGTTASTAATDAAVKRTRGKVLVEEDGSLVHAVYSAVCGGHTENNEVVWGGASRPALRGRLDFPAEGEWLRYAAGIGERDLGSWLAASPPAWCNRSSFRNASKFRWTKRMSAADVNRRVAHLGVGEVKALEVSGRGVSGRVKALKIVGSRRTVTVHRELPVRRLFGNLNSGMFVVAGEKDASGKIATWVFTGGGWGHGVGMCQVGAIGMAEAGHDHETILRHYYNGARIQRIY